jgi:cell pole-organizing protein PopZ
MFKTQSPSASSEKPAPLFGRLSEAIRAASNGNNHSSEPSRSDHALSALKLHRSDNGEVAGAPHFLLSTFHETTTPRADEIASAALVEPSPMVAPAFNGVATAPAMAAGAEFSRSAGETSGAPERSEPQQAAAPAAPQIPRQMAAFKDTRFRSMGSSPAPFDVAPAFVSPFEASATAALVSAAAEAATIADPVQVQPATVEAHGVVPTSAEDLIAVEAPAGLTAAIVASYPSLAPEPLAADVAHVPPPVPVPQSNAGAAEPSGPIEDSTADLLRPMLRQWLAENMPRMVEKALHIEVAESVKSTKK